MLEVLVDAHDGWLDDGEDQAEEQAEVPPPIDLPTAPRRIKRPG
jgi:hypothetical protein